MIQNIKEGAIFAAEVSIPIAAAALALSGWNRARAFAVEVRNDIVRDEEIALEMHRHPELTRAEAEGFVNARDEIKAEDATSLKKSDFALKLAA